MTHPCLVIQFRRHRKLISSFAFKDKNTFHDAIIYTNDYSSIDLTLMLEYFKLDA